MAALVTRVGVLSYRRADGAVVRELRHPDHVFHPASLDSLTAAPVTIGHPGGGQTWVDPDNAKEHEVGYVHSAARDGDHVASKMSVRRADAIKRIDQKELVEVSAAYECKIEETAGTYEGEPYDRVQTDILYNHVALLPAGMGRAGRSVRLRADSDDAEIAEQADHGPERQPPPRQEQQVMTLRKLRVDGVEYELPEMAASLLERTVAERDRALREHTDAQAARDREKKRADSAETERDVAKGQLDPAALQKRVAERVELERAAARVLGTDRRFDSKTDRDVRAEVLKQLSPGFNIDGRSDEAVATAFDYAIAAHQGGRQNPGLRAIASAAPGGPTSEQRADQDDMQRTLKELGELEDQRMNAWKSAAGRK